jgi:hypothetical protein
MGCVFHQALEKTNAEEVQKEVNLYSILLMVAGLLIGLCMFVQVRVSFAEKQNKNNKYLIMKMLGILFDQVDNFGQYVMKYITWCYYGNEDDMMG